MMKLSNLLRTSRLGKLLRLLCLFPIVSLMTITAYAESGSEGTAEGIDKNINSFLTPISDWAGKIVFYAVPIAGQNVPIVLILLAGTAIFLTLYFKFINVRSFGTALKTVKGRYTSADAQGRLRTFRH